MELAIPPGQLLVIDLLGVFAGALLGAQVAARERFDAAGFVALAIASGLGGGLIRDVLVQAGPPLALTRPAYLATAALAALVALLVHVGRVEQRLLTVTDGLALSFFAVSGAFRALEVGLGVGSALLIGVITAVGGGAVRDILAGRPPSIFHVGPLYATAALVAAAVSVALDAAGAGVGQAMGAGVSVGFAVRMLSLRYGWSLPTSPGPGS